MTAALVGSGLAVATPAGAAPARTGTTTVTTPNGTPLQLKGTGVGFTVSWLPTSSPVQAIPGQMATGTFYVTNQTTLAIPVSIIPGTAVPGNNGVLQVQRGADQRFPKIVYAPDSFVSQPKTTTTVSVTVTTPSTLAPGVYIVPAVVVPSPPKGSGNIQIAQEIDALVTFQVAGDVNARLKPTFVGPAPGVPASHHLPGLPTIQMATSGSEVLQVTNDSPTALYAYNEITATQTPFGEVVFKGHTAGDNHDLRNDIALYFPDLHRQYPILWSPSSVGIGTAHITAYVSYHPNPGEITQKSTSVEVLVVSPLWILVPTVFLALLVGLAFRRGRKQVKAKPYPEPIQRSVASRVGQGIASLIVVLVALVGAFLSKPLIFAIVALVGVVLAALLVNTGRRRTRLAMARLVGFYEALVGLVLVVGVVCVVLTLVSTLAADVAVGFIAGAAVWTLIALWAHWWNEERQDPAVATPGYPGSPAAADELVSSAT
jgi:hypothetical protein